MRFDWESFWAKIEDTVVFSVFILLPFFCFVLLAYTIISWGLSL